MIKKNYTKLILVCTLFQLPVITAMAQEIWKKHASPVLKRTPVFPHWKGLATADAFVMVDNDTLKMWYSGSGWLKPTDACPHVRIGYAWSLDGVNWNEHVANPVLDIAADTSSFDADGVETPTVIKDVQAPSNQRYKLWYAGRKLQCSAVLDHKFGYAYSPDGIHWTKHPGNPVLVTGNAESWYNTFISNPSVIKEAGAYKMWFSAPDAFANGQSTDGKANIGYATSLDGINWSVYPAPVIVAGEQSNWDAVASAEPSVLKIGNTYHMFYSALNTWAVEHFQVGYAFSADGISWTKSSKNPVLATGNAQQWDRYWASHPGVIYDVSSNKFKMWYTGRDTATIGNSLTGYFWDIGYAESTFTLGVSDYTNPENALAVYPNPTTGKLNLQISNAFKTISVSIYSLPGTCISIFNNQTEMDLSFLKPGAYFIAVTIDEQTITKKIVKLF